MGSIGIYERRDKLEELFFDIRSMTGFLLLATTMLCQALLAWHSPTYDKGYHPNVVMHPQRLQQCVLDFIGVSLSGERCALTYFPARSKKTRETFMLSKLPNLKHRSDGWTDGGKILQTNKEAPIRYHLLK